MEYGIEESGTPACDKLPPTIKDTINADFYAALIHAPFQRVDARGEGAIAFEDFAAYFSGVAGNEEELKQGICLPSKDGPRHLLNVF
jgi:hypothetical protein